MKRAVIVHAWTVTPELGWYPWLKKELEKNGFSVKTPAMPNTQNPKMNEWVAELTRVVGKPDSTCFLVGHSLGSAAILRYLETLHEGEKIGGVVLVAGASEILGIPQTETLIARPFDWEKIKSRCEKITYIYSDNDPLISLAHSKVFKKNSMPHLS